MRASVRRSIQALLDGADMVTMLAGAVSGAVARLHHRRGHLLPRPGAVLHYSREEDERGIPEHRYILLSADEPTPVPITNVQQIHEGLLHARKTTEAVDEVTPSTV